MALLDDAREALDAGSWSRANSAFRAAVDQTDDPAAFEGLAQVAWWLDDAETCLTSRETAYRRYRACSDSLGASRTAAALAWDCLLFGRGESVAMGWLGRAQSLLAEVEECPEHGWCAVREAELALAVRHDPAAAMHSATRAVAVGHRTGDGDLCVVGSALQGVAMARAGDVEAGLASLDSAVAAATGGDVADQMWMGKVLCWMIAACHETQDITRAEAWCRRVEVICLDRDLVPLLNVCRIQYASVQVSAGEWAEAETELTDTVERLATSSRASRLEAVVQLGELRRLQGRFDEAETLFKQAEFDPFAARGRALIRFEKGDKAGAWSAVRRLLYAQPPDNRLARADVLLPAVRIAHAVGETEAAVLAAAELRRTAARVRTDALLAMSAMADSVLTDSVPTDSVPPDSVPTAGDLPAFGEASTLLLQAVRHYHAAGLRHDEAEARLLLARALMAEGDREAARDQIASATDVLTDLADTVGLQQAADLAHCLDRRDPGLLTAREQEVLRLVSRGMSNDEIATALTLSTHTVHRHVANILAKLNEPTRASAVSHALSRSLI